MEELPGQDCGGKRSSETAVKSRVWLPIASWAVGICIFLGLAWFAGAVAVPCWQARQAVRSFRTGGGRYHEPEAIRKLLGGPQTGARRLSLYLRLPGLFAGADEKRLAVFLLGYCDKSAVPVLLALLDSRDELTRINALRALANLGDEGVDAVPQLLAVISRQERGGVTDDARKIVCGLRDAAVPHLLAALGSPDLGTRIAAAELLGDTGPGIGRGEHEKMISALAGRLHDPEMSRTASEALTKFGSYAVPTLVTVLADPDKEVRYWAARALASMEGEAENAFPALVNLLADDSEDLRCFGLAGLAGFGPRAATAAPAISKLFADPSAQVRRRAARALVNVKRGDKELVPSLVQDLLSNGNPLVRGSSAEAIGFLGASARQAAPALERALQDQDASVRSSAAAARKQVLP